MLRVTRRNMLVSTAALTLWVGSEADAGFVRRGISVIAPLKLHNIALRHRYAAPDVSYGHAFADGDIPAGGSVTLLDSKANQVVVQMDAVALWPSGCARFVVLSHACAETFRAGESKTYTIGSSALPPDNTPAAVWGGSPEATIAANSNFTVEYTGFDAGANTYTVSLNKILSSYSAFPWGTHNPQGGWERTKVGPACMEWHAWQYLINDSTSKPQGYVRCDMWIKAWSPTGPFEIDVRTSQPNMWNTISTHSERYNTSPGRWATLCVVKNGSTVIQNAGGPGDHRTRKISNADFNASTNQITTDAVYSLFPQQGIAFASTGSLPSGISVDTLYWLAYNGSTNPYICTQRYFVSILEQGYPAGWTPNTGYGLNNVVINGNIIYICVQAGTSGSSGGPAGTGNAIADGTCEWENMTIPFFDQGSGKITAYPVNACFPSTAWLTGDRHGNPLWNGAGDRPQIFPGHDFTYLTTKTKFIPPFNSNAGYQTTNQTVKAYAPNENFGGITWNQDTTGDSAGDQRIGYVDGWGVTAVMNPTDRFYVYSSIQAALCFNNANFSYMGDERGGMPFCANNGPKKNGKAYANLPGVLPTWIENGIAGHNPKQFGVGNWLPWSSAFQDLAGCAGQYYIDTSHTPAPWQIPYLKTGRGCFLDQGIHQGNTNAFMQYGAGATLGATTYYCVVNGGNSPAIQERAWAWGLRTLCQAVYVTPASHGFQPVLRDYYNDNAAYHATYYTSYVPPEAVACGFLNVMNFGTPGQTSPWHRFLVHIVVGLEGWRGGLTGSTAGTNWKVLLDYMNAFWGLYTAHPASMYYIGIYDMAYAYPNDGLNNSYQTPLDVFNATLSIPGENTNLAVPYPAGGLYDLNLSGNLFAASFPENCTYYGTIARAALAIAKKAEPTNKTVSLALRHLNSQMATATGISTRSGCVQWYGTQNGIVENYQTFAIF